MITDGPTSYVTGPGGLPVEQIGSDGTVRYFSHDQLGSTTALTDPSGATVQRYSYDAYGQLTSPSPTVENPFQYAGQFTDATTGLQYLRARYYDASTGQFISRDPLEGDTLQAYAHAGNNPTNNIDPTGLRFLSRVSDAAAKVVNVVTFGGAEDITCNGLDAWSGARVVAGTVAAATGIGFGVRYVGGRLAATAAEEIATEELSAEQASNLARYTKKLPADAKEPQITRLPDGSIRFSSDVPGRVPGSYARYTKTVDSAGETTGYTKETYDPAGRLVHSKNKINP